MLTGHLGLSSRDWPLHADAASAAEKSELHKEMTLGMLQVLGIENEQCQSRGGDSWRPDLNQCPAGQRYFPDLYQ